MTIFYAWAFVEFATGQNRRNWRGLGSSPVLSWSHYPLTLRLNFPRHSAAALQLPPRESKERIINGLLVANARVLLARANFLSDQRLNCASLKYRLEIARYLFDIIRTTILYSYYVCTYVHVVFR